MKYRYLSANILNSFEFANKLTLFFTNGLKTVAKASPSTTKAARCSTTKTTRAVAKTTRSARTVGTTRAIAPASASSTVVATSIIATTEEVQTVADVQHSVAGDGINLLIAPAVGIDGSSKVGLFA